MLRLATRSNCLAPGRCRQTITVWQRAFSEGESRVVQLTTDEEFRTAVEGQGAAVINFTAKWCGPCKMISPIYDSLSKEHSDVRFYKVDIDLPELVKAADESGVNAVPTFSFYKDGSKIASFSGADPRQLQQYVQMIKTAP